MNANYSEALERQAALARHMAGVYTRDGFAYWRQRLVDAGDTVTDDDVQAAKLAVQKHAVSLASAQTFYWSRPMCQLLDSAARSMPLNWAPEAESWPASDGFCWFAESIPDNSNSAGFPLDVVAFSWYGADSHSPWIALWAIVSGTIVPIWQDYWPVDASIHTVVTEHRTHTMWWLRIAAAALSLLEQRILVTHHQLAERHTRKRLARDGWQYEPLIQVVELRRRERLGVQQSVDSVERDWQCQWIVRGHWRQQWYPKRKANQPIWITPYVKGPEDKPLKPPRATVFAVVR